MKMLTSGSIAIDVLFQASGLPAPDGFALIYNETRKPGGSSANVTVSACGYGVDGYQVGIVGDDQMGKDFIQSLHDDGVNADYMQVKPGGVTMHTFVITTDNGEHTIFANFGTCKEGFKISQVPADILNDKDVYFTDMFSSFISLPLAIKAHELGKKVVLNIQSTLDFLELCKTTREEMEEALSIADVIIGGNAHLRSILKEDEHVVIEDVVRHIYEKYQPSDGVICTLGSKGAMWACDEGVLRAPAYKLDNVVDTTGAGDAFLGGLIYSFYSANMSKQDCLAFGNGSAAICCAKLGARSAPSVDDVLKFQESH